MIDMNDDRLEALLRAAGESAAPPREPLPGLAERVRGLQARRARNRKVAGGAAAVVLLGMAVYGALTLDGLRGARDPQVADGLKSAPDPEAIKAELARLEAEVRQRQQAVRNMAEADAARAALGRVQPEQDSPSPTELVRIEHEKTAFLLVDRAEQLGTRAQSAAAAEYRRALELFPNTEAARVAEERLKTL